MFFLPKVLFEGWQRCGSAVPSSCHKLYFEGLMNQRLAGEVLLGALR